MCFGVVPLERYLTLDKWVLNVELHEEKNKHGSVVDRYYTAINERGEDCYVEGAFYVFVKHLYSNIDLYKRI